MPAAHSGMEEPNGSESMFIEENSYDGGSTKDLQARTKSACLQSRLHNAKPRVPAQGLHNLRSRKEVLAF